MTTDPNGRPTLPELLDQFSAQIDAARARHERERPHWADAIPWELMTDAAGRPVHLELVSALVQGRAAEILADTVVELRQELVELRRQVTAPRVVHDVRPIAFTACPISGPEAAVCRYPEGMVHDEHSGGGWTWRRA